MAHEKYENIKVGASIHNIVENLEKDSKNFSVCVSLENSIAMFPIYNCIANIKEEVTGSRMLDISKRSTWVAFTGPT